MDEIILRDLMGFGFGGTLVAVALFAFRALLKRVSDTTPQWLELAVKTLEGFKMVTDNLSALKTSIEAEASERRRDNGQATELLTSLGKAMTDILDILKTMMGDLKTMGEEAEKRRLNDSADTKTRLDALREELARHNIRLTALEKAVQDIQAAPIMQPDALDKLTATVLAKVEGIHTSVVLEVKTMLPSLVKEALQLILNEHAKAAPHAPDIVPDTPKRAAPTETGLPPWVNPPAPPARRTEPEDKS